MYSRNQLTQQVYQPQWAHRLQTTSTISSTGSTCSPTLGTNLRHDATSRYISNRCNATQKLMERIAWAEAGLLANAMSNTSFRVWIFH
jgi:hypothetical protein